MKAQDGVYRTYPATWAGRYILDVYVIADEFRQMGPNGELAQLGQNYRSYNTNKKTWVMKWRDALASTWQKLRMLDALRERALTLRHATAQPASDAAVLREEPPEYGKGEKPARVRS